MFDVDMDDAVSVEANVAHAALERLDVEVGH